MKKMMNMKKTIFVMLALLLGTTTGIKAQVTIGSSSAPAKSAVLDLNTGGSHDKGLLLPRLDLADATDISKLSDTPATGLMVYATGDTSPGDKLGLKEGVYTWDGAKWSAGGGSTISIPVTGITVSPTAVIFPATDSPTRTLAAAVLPACANQAVTWESANEAVATVDANGVVTPVSQGTTTITATAVDNGGKTAGSLITVVPVHHVTGVEVTPKTYSFLAENEQKQLTATVFPSNADNPTINWSSNHPEIAEVNVSTGVVTAKAFGTARITATAVDGGGTYSDFCDVEVFTHVASISLDRYTHQFNANGQEFTLTAYINPVTATNQNVTWSSSATGVATVTSISVDPLTGTATALVRAVGAGSATIKVTSADGGRQATCAVTNYLAVTGVAVTPKNVDRVFKTPTQKLRATYTPANAYNKNTTWISDDPTVATVNSITIDSALVTCISHGTTIVRAVAQDGGSTDFANITCTMVVFAADGTMWGVGPNIATTSAAALCQSPLPVKNYITAATTAGVNTQQWYTVFGSPSDTPFNGSPDNNNRYGAQAPPNNGWSTTTGIGSGFRAMCSEK